MFTTFPDSLWRRSYDATKDNLRSNDSLDRHRLWRNHFRLFGGRWLLGVTEIAQLQRFAVFVERACLRSYSAALAF